MAKSTRDERINSAFTKATEAIRELEIIIREKYETPKRNLNIENYDGIRIPGFYVRPASYFRSEYKLSLLISDPVQLNNIAYALQASDLYNYFVNRFHLYGVIKNLFIKQTIINLFAIQEGILYSTIMTLHGYCVFNNKVCKKASSCAYYIKSRSNLSFNDLIKIYDEKINFNDEKFVTNLKKLKAIRDCIHLEDVKFSEWSGENVYSLDFINKAVWNLHFIKYNLHEKVSVFKKLRDGGCTQRNDLKVKKIVCNLSSTSLYRIDMFNLLYYFKIIFSSITVKEFYS
jgi:hypothetical protein